jgi:chemotaxis protein MotB
MSMKDEPRVRIIVKKGHGGGHHGGAWKVAYADFVTTMMALFIVLWIVSQNDALKQSIASYFKDPGAFKEGRAPVTTPGGSGLLPGGRPDPEFLQSTSAANREEKVLVETADRIRELTSAGGPFANLHDQVKVEVTPEGLRIELMERDGVPFFEVGRAVLVQPLKPLLESLEPILSGLPNSITVEGHTDGRQYVSTQKNYSNWELSTDRSNAARRVMEEHGLPIGRIDRVAGHADRNLRVAEDPLDASNRRITLLVRRQEPAGRAGLPASGANTPAAVILPPANKR